MKTIVGVFLLAFLAAFPAFAQPDKDFAKAEPGTYSADRSHSRLIFSYSHFGYSVSYGLFNDFSGTLKIDPRSPIASSLEVTVNMNGIDTTVPELDGRLKSAQFFDVAKFPTAVFKSTGIVATGPDTGTVSGELTLHGVTRPVTLSVTFNGGGIHPANKKYVVGFNATGVIKRSEFGVGAFAPMVGDEITLTISSEFDRAS